MDNVLIHHGVLGQKWGVIRRSLRNRIEVARKKTDSKYRSSLSDDELEKKIKRLKMEKELRELTENEVDRGRKFKREIMESAGKRIATTVLSEAGIYVGRRFVSRVFKSNDMGNAVLETKIKNIKLKNELKELKKKK